MKNIVIRSRAAIAVVFLVAVLVGGCASSDPSHYTAPSQAPSRTLRSPVVAPSGPGSPWWWPLPADWFPIQPWG